jgi:dTDP-4-dehydrorhamnose 3,5-epimerase
VIVIETNLPEVLIIEPKVFGDSRGYFFETWQQSRYEEIGITENFVQDNVSFSSRGVLRGLHYQHPHSQGKLVSVLQGEVFDVAVDIRIGSPSFGQWAGVVLSEANHRQLWVPPGFAHGFCVTSEFAYFSYKCTNLYTPQAEGGIIWNDPDIGIAWPLKDVVLSAKDCVYARLKAVAADKLPTFKER